MCAISDGDSCIRWLNLLRTNGSCVEVPPLRAQYLETALGLQSNWFSHVTGKMNLMMFHLARMKILVPPLVFNTYCKKSHVFCKHQCFLALHSLPEVAWVWTLLESLISRTLLSWGLLKTRWNAKDHVYYADFCDWPPRETSYLLKTLSSRREFNKLFLVFQAGSQQH